MSFARTLISVGAILSSSANAQITGSQRMLVAKSFATALQRGDVSAVEGAAVPYAMFIQTVDDADPAEPRPIKELIQIVQKQCPFKFTDVATVAQRETYVFATSYCASGPYRGAALTIYFQDDHVQSVTYDRWNKKMDARPPSVPNGASNG